MIFRGDGHYFAPLCGKFSSITMALLDMANIIKKWLEDISGLSTEKLWWITGENYDWMFQELDPKVFEDIDMFMSENEYY